MSEVKIKFQAQNKYLLVETLREESEEQPNIVLPENYKKKENPFKIARIINAQRDSPFYEHIGSFALFPSNALEVIDVHGMRSEMIPSHVVYGILKMADEDLENAPE